MGILDPLTGAMGLAKSSTEWVLDTPSGTVLWTCFKSPATFRLGILEALLRAFSATFEVGDLRPCCLMGIFDPLIH